MGNTQFQLEYKPSNELFACEYLRDNIFDPLLPENDPSLFVSYLSENTGKDDFELLEGFEDR